MAFYTETGSPDCNKKGEYFIADLVLVKQAINPITRAEYWDVLIADIKYSDIAPFTENQVRSADLNGFVIKAPKNDDINGSRIIFVHNPKLPVRKTIRPREFLKIYGNGNGQYKAMKFEIPVSPKKKTK